MIIREGDFAAGLINGAVLSIPVWSILFIMVLRFIQ